MFRTFMIHTFGIASLCRAATVLAAAVLLAPSLSGCAVLGIIAQAAPPATVEASYKGLAGQTVAVMAWADDTGVRIDWPQIQLDTADTLQHKLQIAQNADKPKELERTTFPVSPASVARLQEERPDLVAGTIEEIAPKLGASRVIYVELHSFQTRSEVAEDLFRGSIRGSVRVVEVVNGKGRVAFTDDNIHVVFPKNSPEEGEPNLGDYAIYRGVLDAFTSEVAIRFFAHEAPQH